MVSKNYLKKFVNPLKNPLTNILQALEMWLTDLGAVKDVNNQSKWYWLLSNWNATIIFEQEDLSVIWESEGQETKRLFSYCITREDVKTQYCRDLKFLAKNCSRFALLSSNFFLIDHPLCREAARGK